MIGNVLMDVRKASEILKAVAHPVRLTILNGLKEGTDCNVSEMAERLGLPQSTVSQHLAVLRNHGLIEPQKDGVRTCYRIRDERMFRLLDIFGG